MFTTLIAHNIPKSMSALLATFFLFIFAASWADKNLKKKRIFNIVFLALVIFIGLYFRLSLAWFFKGNYDIWNWEETGKIVAKGGNIYAQLSLYKYFPLWAIILGFLKKIHTLMPGIKFYFIIKSFLTLIDLAILYLLILLAKIYKKSFIKTAAAFFLNPVSVIITGFHGQFENIAVLFIVLAIYIFKKYKKFSLGWLTFTIGGIAKHMFINQPLIFLNQVFKKNRIKVFYYFFLSGLIALATLVPYWRGGKDSIIRNLLLYSYIKENYGMSFILSGLGLEFLLSPYRYLFIVLFFVLPFFINGKKLSSACLLGALFFVSFTPGISDQFFTIPLALGSLTGSFWLYFYSLFACLYLFGSSAQFDIAFFKVFSDNIIFLISVFWFIAEYIKNHEP